jgi:hypothetical protein
MLPFSARGSSRVETARGRGGGSERKEGAGERKRREGRRETERQSQTQQTQGDFDAEFIKELKPHRNKYGNSKSR